MPSLNLSEILHRDPRTPTLRERAAALRVSVGRLKQHKALPEPGSPEAMAAFQAACSATDRLSHAAKHGYPALDRHDGSSWTADSLSRALDTGEVTPAEYARLIPMAMEREHRMDAARLATNLDALFALAYARDYPQPPVEEDASTGAASPDLVAMSSELDGLRGTLKADTLPHHGGDAEVERASMLLRQVFEHPADNLADLHAKVAVHRAFEGWWEADHASILRSLIADLERLSSVHLAAASNLEVCEAERLGRQIAENGAEILRLDEAGGSDDMAPLSAELRRADQRDLDLCDALSRVRARSPEGMLAQIAVAGGEIDHVLSGASREARSASHQRVERLLYSVAACLARLHGIDRNGHGAGRHFPASLDRLAILDRAEA